MYWDANKVSKEIHSWPNSNMPRYLCSFSVERKEADEAEESIANIMHEDHSWTLTVFYRVGPPQNKWSYAKQYIT